MTDTAHCTSCCCIGGDTFPGMPESELTVGGEEELSWYTEDGGADAVTVGDAVCWAAAAWAWAAWAAATAAAATDGE